MDQTLSRLQHFSLICFGKETEFPDAFAKGHILYAT
jgi:hypothetical protein